MNQNNNTKICMFVFNNFTHDSRVLREAKTLMSTGCKVDVIALLDSNTVPYEEIEGVSVRRVCVAPAHLKVIKLLKNLKSSCFKCVLAVKVKVYDALRFIAHIFFSEKNFSNIQTSGCIAGISKCDAKKYNKYSLLSAVKKVKDRIKLILHINGYNKFASKDNCSVTGNACFNKKNDFSFTFHRLFCFLDYYYRCGAQINAKSYGVYHAHDLNTLPIAWLLSRKGGAKLVYDSHELYVERNRIVKRTFLNQYLLGRIESFLIKRCDRVITVNDSIADELSFRYGIFKPSVLMNAPSCQRAVLCESEADIRSVSKIQYDHKLLLYCGGITFNRGLENVIKSLIYMPNVHLVLMGYGSEKYKNELRIVGDEAGVSQRFEFYGPVPSEQVTSYACGADLGIAPIENVCLSYYYCSPNKVFEYINAGLPVVASDFPEMKKVISQFGIGTVFDPSSPQDIARAVSEILDNPERNELCRNNSRNAAGVFNWENEDSKLKTIYQGLI